MTTLLYVLLDGFDLGVGILFGFTRNEDSRRKMLSAISPVWDGNETWLVFTGTILWGAFPRVYATLLSAFYLPIILMLGALILRGVSFEFRDKALGSRWIWDFGFWGGSLIAAFVKCGWTVLNEPVALPVHNESHEAFVGPPNPVGPTMALLRQPHGAGLPAVSQLPDAPV